MSVVVNVLFYYCSYGVIFSAAFQESNVLPALTNAVVEYFKVKCFIQSNVTL